MRTAIVTDTNSGLTVEEGKKAGIYVLPMPVIIDGKNYLEGVDITNEQLYAALRADRDVSSSQPSPGDVMAVWNKVFEDGYDELVYIPMSSGLSGSCHNAVQLAAEYGSRVWVADNHRISVTLMESVLDAKFWLALARSAFPKSDVYYIPLSCSIACHVGINAAGLGVSVIEEGR